MSTESIFIDVTIKSETDAERFAEAIEKSIIENGNKSSDVRSENYELEMIIQ